MHTETQTKTHYLDTRTGDKQMWRHMTDWGDKTHFRETTGEKANKKHNLET